jgi:hypothetical protein
MIYCNEISVINIIVPAVFPLTEPLQLFSHPVELNLKMLTFGKNVT